MTNEKVKLMRLHKHLLTTSLIIAGTLMTMPLWRSLLVAAYPGTEQRVQSDVVRVKNPLTPTVEPSSRHLVFAGSGVNLQIVRLLAEAFKQSHPDEFQKIDVPTTIGSTGAIQAVADGAITVGLISRPLKDQEKKLGLTVVPYAQTATAIATHPSVAEDGITSSELIHSVQ